MGLVGLLPNDLYAVAENGISIVISYVMNMISDEQERNEVQDEQCSLKE